MTTILTAFLLALVISLGITPAAGRLGKRLGAVDLPNPRKIHSVAMPRTGGLAIFVCFLLVLLLTKLWDTDVTRLLVLGPRTQALLLGSLLAFGIGLVDDFRRLRPGIKFLFQAGAATVAFWGGLRIETFGVMSSSPVSMLWSYGLTVLWFVLIINAVNLADGMDGLAGGIVLFACVVMIVLTTMRHEYMTGMLFAILAGATLGFLRYNFNPATIFLGDGGSYFLGYAIAGLSILSGAKTQMGAILLIPVLALGLPLFDTILAPIRRFIRGRGLFSPDREHIHHRLRAMGLTSRNVTLVFYAISAGLCILALILVNLEDEQAGLFLIVLGIGAIFFIRKLGYFEYFALDKIYGWLRDVTDVSGLSHERRTFLSIQMEMASAGDVEGLWEHTVAGMEMLRFDVGEMRIDRQGSMKAERTEVRGQRSGASRRGSGVGGQESGCGKTEGEDPPTLGFPDRRKGPVGRRKTDNDRASFEGCGNQGPGRPCPICGKYHQTESGWHSTWVQKGFDLDNGICGESLLKLELPLLRDDGWLLGTLWLVKDLKREPVTHYTLRRVEHLRRTLTSTLDKLQFPPNSKQ